MGREEEEEEEQSEIKLHMCYVMDIQNVLQQQ